MMSEAILVARGVTKVFQLGRQEVRALRGVDLTVREGEFIALVGPSGSGKTTLLNLVGALDVPTSGELVVLGRHIATLGIGYADGYPRALSNRGSAMVGGRRVCVAGTVTMDMTMVDVTDAPCALGDVATVIGGDGDLQLDIASVARTADMSPYELLTGLRSRISRVYRSDGVRT